MRNQQIILPNRFDEPDQAIPRRFVLNTACLHFIRVQLTLQQGLQ